MRKTQIILVFVLCLLFTASTAFAQKAKTTVTNTDVLELSKAGLSESTIILALGRSKTNFNTSPKSLIDLRKQNVSNNVLAAVLRLQMKNDFVNSVDRKTKNTLTNAEVIELTKAGVGADVIITAIFQANSNFDTSTKNLIQLKKQGVNTKVLEAMLRRQNSF